MIQRERQFLVKDYSYIHENSRTETFSTGVNSTSLQILQQLILVYIHKKQDNIILYYVLK